MIRPAEVSHLEVTDEPSWAVLARLNQGHDSKPGAVNPSDSTQGAGVSWKCRDRVDRALAGEGILHLGRVLSPVDMTASSGRVHAALHLSSSSERGEKCGDRLETSDLFAD